MSPDDPEDGPQRAVSEDEARAAAASSSPEAVEDLVENVPVARKHSNVEQTLIEVTEDRLTLVMNDAANKLAQRREWMGPAGLFSGLLLSLLTANFKEAFGVDAQIVQGVVIAVTCATGVWTLVTVLRAIRGRSKAKIVADTVKALKG